MVIIGISVSEMFLMLLLVLFPCLMHGTEPNPTPAETTPNPAESTPTPDGSNSFENHVQEQIMKSLKGANETSSQHEDISRIIEKIEQKNSQRHIRPPLPVEDLLLEAKEHTLAYSHPCPNNVPLQGYKYFSFPTTSRLRGFMRKASLWLHSTWSNGTTRPIMIEHCDPRTNHLFSVDLASLPQLSPMYGYLLYNLDSVMMDQLFHKDCVSIGVDIRNQADQASNNEIYARNPPYLDVTVQPVNRRRRSYAAPDCLHSAVNGDRAFPCCRHAIPVDFSQIPQMIYPHNITLHKCMGYCEHPFTGMNHTMNHTNHGMFLKFMEGDGLRPPASTELCCVPKDYHPVTIAMNSGNGVMVSVMRKMDAADCQCLW